MEWAIWGFVALFTLVAVIIAGAAWRVLRRDRDSPNLGPQKPGPAMEAARRMTPKGVPKTR